MEKEIFQGRLNGRQRNKLKGLFDMEYRPSELADELGIRRNQIYTVYLPLGCPNERDQWNHILINGKDFKKWYLEKYQKTKVANDETFCRTCQIAVRIENGLELRKGGLTYVISHCPKCGRVISKITKCNKRNHDQQE